MRTAEDFPLFLCRPGDVEDCCGVRIEPGFATDEDDLKAKLADGWCHHPDDFVEKPRRGRPPNVKEDTNGGD